MEAEDEAAPATKADVVVGPKKRGRKPKTKSSAAPAEGPSKGKRARRSKLQKKDSEYLYEFEDTDTEEDQAAQNNSGDRDRNYHANSDSGSDSDGATKEPATATTAASSPPPPPPAVVAASTSPVPAAAVTAESTGVPPEPRTPSGAQRCNQCHAHNSLKTCPRSYCSWCCKHSEEGPCAAHDRSKRKREPVAEATAAATAPVVSPTAPAKSTTTATATATTATAATATTTATAITTAVAVAAKPPPPPGKRGRGRPRKHPLPSAPAPTPTAAPSGDATSAIAASGTPVTASPNGSATTAASPRPVPMGLEASAAAAGAAVPDPPAVGGGQGKSTKAAKKRELDKAGEQVREAKRRQMQEKRFVRLYRSLRRMSHVEAKRRDMLEAGRDPNEGVVNGILYRKVKRSVVDNINGPTPNAGAGANDDDFTDDEQEESKKKDGEQGEEREEAEKEGERCWVDRYGWPLEEEVYMGTDIVAEWEAWRDEHQRREDQLESARRAAAAAAAATSSSSSSSTSTSTSLTAESASAIFSSPHHLHSNGYRRGSMRGENGFGGWNDDRGLAASSVSFDNISDDDSDDDDDGHNRRARFGARSLSFDAAGGGRGGVDSGDEAGADVYTSRSNDGRPRFMSRHAAKMRKRYPMLAEWRASSMTYEDKRQLMRDITLLDADHVPELLKIIFRQMPDSFATRQMLAQTIDLDVSFLSPATLSRVEDYVYTVLGKRHGQHQLHQQQQRRRSVSVSLNSSSGSLCSPPHTPLTGSSSSLRRRRASSSVVSIEQHGSDDDSWLRDHGDGDESIDVDSINIVDGNDSFLGNGQGDRRPRRDSGLSTSAPVTITTPHRPTAGKGKAKGSGERRLRGSGKARKTERNTSPRGEETRGRRRSASTDGDSATATAATEVDSGAASTPSIVISTPADQLAVATPASSANGDEAAAVATSPPGRRGSTPGGRTPRKRKNSTASSAKTPSPPPNAAAVAAGTPSADSLALPPKQPKQASPTVRPRRTRKVRMYDPYGDKSGQALSKPLHGCLEILQELMAHEYGWVFNTPVDPLSLNIPDYFDVIKNPMDLGTIKTQLQSGHYETPEEFAADVRLVWNNALTYNEQDNEVHVLAKEFQAAFERSYAPIQAEWDRHKQLHPTPAAAAAAASPTAAAEQAAAPTAATPSSTSASVSTPADEGGEAKGPDPSQEREEAAKRDEPEKALEEGEEKAVAETTKEEDEAKAVDKEEADPEKEKEKEESVTIS